MSLFFLDYTAGSLLSLQYFIGASYNNITSDWRWVDGLTIDSQFLTSYPVTGSSGDCLVWNDVDLLNQHSCSLTQPFICEKAGVTQASITTTTTIPTTATISTIATTITTTTTPISTIATTIPTTTTTTTPISTTTTIPTTTATILPSTTTISTTSILSTTTPTTTITTIPTTTVTTISPTITTTVPTTTMVPTTTLTSTSSPCPSPYIWKPAASLCYKNYEDTEKWLDAKTMCTGYGARLAILDTAAKLSSVLDGKCSIELKTV